MGDKLDELYKLYEDLAGAEKEGKLAENSAIFESIISRASTGDTKEKRLVSQFIAKFFKHFPTLEIRAVEAQIELCDDTDINVRKQAIHDLPSFCAKGTDDPYISRIAIVLCQLLTVEDRGELAIVEKSLNTLLRQSVHATVKGVLGQMVSASCEDAMRDACIRFLASKVNLKTLDSETELMLVEEAGKVAALVGGEEFVLLVKLLNSLKVSRQVSQQKAILKMISDQLQLTAPAPMAPDASQLVKLTVCLPLAVPLFSPYATALPYVAYLVNTFLPTTTLEAPESLDILKLLAQMAPHALKPSDGVEVSADVAGEPVPEATEEELARRALLNGLVQGLFAKVCELLPAVPVDDDLEKDPELPSLQLSHLECLLYTFHSIARKIKPTALDDDVVLKDVRQRLQYLNRGLQAEAKKFKGLITQGVTLEAEKKQALLLALKTTSNLTAFIKDWFHNPPTFKTNVTLSWLQAELGKDAESKPQAKSGGKAAPNGTGGTNQENKRKTIVYDSDGPPTKRTHGNGSGFGGNKPGRQLYQAPRGGGRFRSRW
ncbi:apoptosis inhibitor 5-like [Tropilaelaps mercedesae]|uniref:Apoptosis inhibitor 5-like n=1 Tax=Tropilaelaps mercedesae TaxID=418985 RepID=A0A1V9XN48_9ACAR|nr:apoptosis inhibitor 5-like [Tropilaelaps mercedesae]